MPQLASRTTIVKPSSTLAADASLNKLRAAGIDVLSLSTGVPDFKTPEAIKAAAITAIEQNQTNYTDGKGLLALRQRLSEKFKSENNLDYSPDAIVLTSGTKPLLHAAFYALADAGDEIIIPAPYWVSYPAIAKFASVTPVIVPTRAEDGFKLRPEDLRASITPRTKILLLNTPNNPTGAIYDRNSIAALYEVLEDYPDIWVITDEIYEHIAHHASVKFISPASISAAAKDKTITINGFSKSYAMIGWRLGFLAGPQEVVNTISGFLGHLVGAPNTVTQYAALAGLDGATEQREHNRQVYRERFEETQKILADIDGLTVIPTAGAYYFYIDVSGFIGATLPDGKTIQSDQDFALGLQEHALVSVLSGSAFGLSPYIRLSYAQSLDELKKALLRLRSFCASLKR